MHPPYDPDDSAAHAIAMSNVHEKLKSGSVADLSVEPSTAWIYRDERQFGCQTSVQLTAIQNSRTGLGSKSGSSQKCEFIQWTLTKAVTIMFSAR